MNGTPTYNLCTENFELLWHNVHCRHIVLDGSGDRGYTGFLREYTQTSEDCQRITLLEGLPFPRDLATLASAADLSVIRSASLFRQEKLEVDLVQSSNAAIRSSVSISSPTSATNQNDPPLMATVVKGLLVHPQAAGSSSSNTKLSRKLFFNAKGHRLEGQMPKYDKGVRNNLYNLFPKLCFDHHLNQSCQFEQCSFSHGKTLSPTELETLKSMGRMTPCSTSKCQDPNCYKSHRCPFDGRCCGDCRFPPDMHKVDMRIQHEETVTI